MKELEKTTSDLRTYVGQMEELARKCSPEHRSELNEIFRSILILLVSLRKASHLGEIQINFKDMA